MKRLFMIAAAALIALTVAGCSYEKVPAGNVGVMVDLYGEDKGTQIQPVGVGRYWVGIGEELHVFPTFTQNYVWTAGEDDTSPANESISFSDKDGLTINTDIGISYRLDPDKVPELFERYRRGVDEITDTFLYNMVRDALVSEASRMPVEAIYGEGKSDLMARVQERVSSQVADQGIQIDRIYWIGEMRLPEAVRAALNAKIEATQRAQQRENEVAEAIAAANKAREEARGAADAQLLRAQAEAEAIRIRGEALRENAALVELTLAERWDGKMPTTYVGGSEGEGRILQILTDQNR